MPRFEKKNTCFSQTVGVRHIGFGPKNFPPLERVGEAKNRKLKHLFFLQFPTNPLRFFKNPLKCCGSKKSYPTNCLISEHTVKGRRNLMVTFTSLQPKYQKKNLYIHLFQSSPQNWKPNPLENPQPQNILPFFFSQPREVARALAKVAWVMGPITLFHPNFPTSERFPGTFSKNTSKTPKITYPPGDFKAMRCNNMLSFL